MPGNPSFLDSSPRILEGALTREVGNFGIISAATMSSIPSHRVSAGERINIDAPPGHLQRELKARRIRLTRQRRVVLQVMESATEHMDANEILERAQKIDADITQVTVYRTLELLKSFGLIDELDVLHLRAHRHYYESHGPRDHIHVACIRCGKVREFESELYEQLKSQISRDCGIEITVTRTEVGGLCADCRKPRSHPTIAST